MSGIAAFFQSWTALSPEIALVILIVFHLAFDLYRKTDPITLIRSAVLGAVLMLVILFLLWPSGSSLFGGAFRLDSFAILLKAVFLISGILTLVMTHEYVHSLGERAADFVVMILIAVLGGFFLASSTDLITLFVTIEWMTLSLYVLTAYQRTEAHGLEAGTKYLIMGVFSSALFLYGTSFVYGAVGALGFDQIRAALPLVSGNLLFRIGLLLIFSGIGFKISAFPFQLWVPDVYQGAPTPVTAFLSTGSKTAGLAALLKIAYSAVGTEHLNWPVFLSFLSAATLLYGNLGALGQTNMKRLFAYSSIGHAGYLLMAVAAGTPFGAAAALFYLVVYVISNLAAFLVIVVVNRDLNAGEIVSYRGLAKKAPLAAGVFFIALLSLGGIPPLAGFFGKFLVFQAAISRGYLWLALLGALNVIVSLYYYLSIVREMFFKQGASDRGRRIRFSPGTQAFLLLLSLGMIGIGIFQEPILTFAKAGAQTLF